MHHQDKADAPSGTAIATAHKIAAGRTQKPLSTIDNDARGQRIDDVPVHAIRLPGYIAHEQVLFGGPGEALTIRQDSFDRQSFMQGVAVAIRKVQAADHLVVGLKISCRQKERADIPLKKLGQRVLFYQKTSQDHILYLSLDKLCTRVGSRYPC